MSESAGVCAHCGGVIPPMDGGRCPDCHRELDAAAPAVEETQPEPPVRAPGLVPTFPPPPLMPMSLAITRDEDEPPTAIAERSERGPYRTPGRGFREQRRAGLLVIQGEGHPLSQNIAILLLAGAVAAGVLFPVSLATVAALLTGFTALFLAVLTHRSRPRIELTDDYLDARSWVVGHRRLLRTSITHLHVVDVPGRPLARVEAVIGAARFVLVVADRGDAAAIAALLAHELRLPTRVPALGAGDAT